MRGWGGVPSARSQSRSVLSLPALASVCPSGEKRHIIEPARVSLEALRGLAAHGIPEPHRPILASAGERVPIGARGCYPPHRVGVAVEALGESAAYGIPEPHRPVPAGTGKRVPIRRERHPQRPAGVALQGSGGLAIGGVPEHRPAARAGERVPIG